MNILNQLKTLKGLTEKRAELLKQRHAVGVEHGGLAIQPRYQVDNKDSRLANLQGRINKIDEEIAGIDQLIIEKKSEPAFVELSEKRLGALRGVARDLREQLDASNLDYRLKRSEYALDVLAGGDPLELADKLEAIKDQSRRLTRAAELVQDAIREGVVK